MGRDSIGFETVHECSDVILDDSMMVVSNDRPLLVTCVHGLPCKGFPYETPVSHSVRGATRIATPGHSEKSETMFRLARACSVG